MENIYVVVCWPDIQDYMDLDGFDENAYLINDSKGLDDFGSSAYFINKAWKDKVEEQREINLRLSLVEAKALYACGNIGQDIALSVFTKEELGCDSSKFIKYKRGIVYPIGTKLFIDGKKCIVKKIQNVLVTIVYLEIMKCATMQFVSLKEDKMKNMFILKK